MSILAPSLYPRELEEASAEMRLEYIRKKKRQSLLLYRVCIGLCALFVILKSVTFLDPATAAANTLIAEILVIGTFLLTGIGLRTLVRKYSAIEINLNREIQ